MADDALRQLNEAVIPRDFSIERKEEDAAAGAALRLTREGWSAADRDEATLSGAAARAAVEPWTNAGSDLSRTLSRGNFPVVSEGNTEVGLTFGRRSVMPRDEYQLQNEIMRRGKTIGVYFGLKF